MGHHRPATRSKNKRSRPEDTAETTSEILRRVLLTNTVTEDDAHQLYMIWKPVCQGCRVNAKDNPNCFCGLIPPPNGSRKSGLWQKTSEIVNSMGPDLSTDLRSSLKTPAGLTNLGATCYANSILQCLYMNRSFREGIFSVEPDVLEGDPVLFNLARLFAQLHHSNIAFVDSAPFIKTLELDNAVQQDSHEFLTLLFSLLEQCLSECKVSKARTIVQDLFRGRVSHVTRCSKCGNESEASSKIEDFYGLELNVKGLNSLDESLDDYLSIEELIGDNQYYCDSCDTRADAMRCIKLRALPALLNFQLKRCIFLPNTTTKKKITSVFHFPGELNMGKRLSDNSQLDLTYDLSAVLIHKGSTVNSGHYTAHIKDDVTGEWWEFDDEHVSSLGQEPFGSSSSIPDAKSGHSEPECSSSARQENIIVQNHMDAKKRHSLDLTSVHHLKTFSSNDAYMLMYVLRHSKSDSGRITIGYGELKNESYGQEISREMDSCVPSHLLKDIETSNAAYLDSCERYRSKKEFELNRIMERREEVRLVLSEAPVHSIERSCFWICTNWLRDWADSIMPSIIDNTLIQCSHGKLALSRISSMKRLSAEAWSRLYSQYNGGPILAKEDYCMECIFEMGHNMARSNIYRDQRSVMKELAEAALSGEHPDGKLYYVSKPWLQQWLRRKNTDFPCDADSGPTASIRCPHGELLPQLAHGAKRVMVPEKLWIFFLETALEVKPNDSQGHSTFTSDSQPCTACSVELTEAAFSEDNLREFKLKQRQNHEKLSLNKSVALYPDNKYYLVPSSWLSTWRTYINSSGKNAPPAELEVLSNIIDTLLCEKHGKLLERPPELLWKRDLLFQKPSTTDGLTIVGEDDWRLFCEKWGGTESKGISATVEIDSCVDEDAVGDCKYTQISEEHLLIDDGVTNGPSRRVVLRTFPEVCEECAGERESSELMRKLNYSNENICVCLIRGKEPPKSILEASGSILESSRRTSKRSRKATYGNSVNLNVSGTTSVYQLKMMIWESFGVVKENQILHKGSRIIDVETASLADMNIFPRDILWVTDSKIHENRDIADELSNTNVEVQVAEEGFRGTLLTSAISSQVVSGAYLN